MGPSGTEYDIACDTLRVWCSRAAIWQPYWSARSVVVVDVVDAGNVVVARLLPDRPHPAEEGRWFPLKPSKSM